MRIQQQSVSKLASLMLALSLLLGIALTGCSDKDIYYNCCGNGNGGGGEGDLSRRHKIYYEFSQETLAKAVEAGATHVAGFAYNDRATLDSKFSIAETEIAKMKQAKNGDYMAELNVSGYVKHIDLYFYYKEGNEKLATNCKYIHTDFASLNKDEDIIIDCDANDAYFTIKTYDSLGQETSRFAAGDKVYAKVFVTCQGDDSFYVPFPSPDDIINDDRTFTLGELVSDATDVVDKSAQENDEYKVLDALTQGTANLYVNNLGFTCLFSEHAVNVGPADPEFTALYIAPAGYTVSGDGGKILDPNGTEVAPSRLPKEQEIAAGANHTFVAIGAQKTAAGTTYELMGNKADAVLTTESQNINNDGFKVSVAAGATEADTATIGATYGDLNSNTIKIKVAVQVTYTALYLAPEGYTVSRDGSKILDPNGTEVLPARLPEEQVIVAGGEHTFVAIGAKKTAAGTTYELMGNQADAVLDTDSQNINNDGFKVSVVAGATVADEASIQATLGTLVSNVVNITVEAPITYNALYLAPEGYTVSDDGTQIVDPNGTEVDPADLPAEQVIAAGEEHVFVAIGAKGDTAVTYELLGDTAEAVLTTESANIVNDGFTVSVADAATNADAATIKATYDDLTSNIVNIVVPVNYTALYIVPRGYDPSDDGTEIRDPYDDPVDPANLPTKKTMEFGTNYTFNVIGAIPDAANPGSVLYSFVYDATAVLTTESTTITNDDFKVIVDRTASDDDTAIIKATYYGVESGGMTVQAVPFRAIYVCDGRMVLAPDGSKIYDPEYPDDPYVYEDFLLGVNFSFGWFQGDDVPFILIAVDTTQQKLIQIDVKADPGDDDAHLEITGENPDSFTLNLAASSVHIKDDANDGDECYVSASYRGLESDPESFIITTF